MSEKIRILLIDDHTLFRSGIKALLARQTDCEVVGEAADGLNGRETLAQIMSVHPEQTVLMLTISEDGDDLTECMRLGARGYLLKNIHADFLIEAVKKAYHGDNIFSPEMTARLVQSLIRPHQPESTPLDELTARELEILGHLSAGHSNKIIARHLDLAESTVKVHVQNILRKLELDSRVQAAVYAVQHNIPLPNMEKHNNK